MELSDKKDKEYLFEHHFPILNDIMVGSFAQITNLDVYLKGKPSDENYTAFKESVRGTVFPMIEDELLRLIPEWQRLTEVKGASVALHSLIVLYLVTNDPRMKQLSAEQQNIIKWSALLHDIAKRGKPEFCGRDHTHPFAGGLAVLKIFKRIGFLDSQFSDIQVKDESLEEVYELIERSLHAPAPEDYGKKF